MAGETNTVVADKKNSITQNNILNRINYNVRRFFLLFFFFLACQHDAIEVLNFSDKWCLSSLLEDRIDLFID